MKRFPAVLLMAGMALAAFGQDIGLPAPKAKVGLDLIDALKARSTSRSFVAKDIPLEDLSTVLWASNGIKSIDAVSSASKANRTIPYSGDKAYLNTYVFTAKGAYLYQPEKNALKQLGNKEVRDKITGEFIKTSPVLILFTVDGDALPSHFKGNGVISGAFGTAGEAASNVAIAASAFKLSSIIMYNIDAKTLPEAVALGKNETPVMLLQIGYAR
jgi:nitroreductase